MSRHRHSNRHEPAPAPPPAPAPAPATTVTPDPETSGCRILIESCLAKLRNICKTIGSDTRAVEEVSHLYFFQNQKRALKKILSDFYVNSTTTKSLEMRFAIAHMDSNLGSMKCNLPLMDDVLSRVCEIFRCEGRYPDGSVSGLFYGETLTDCEGEIERLIKDLMKWCQRLVERERLEKERLERERLAREHWESEQKWREHWDRE